MTAATLSASRIVGGFRYLAERSERLALTAILVAAAANFFWQLGSSSYFTDEAFSVMHSLPSFGLLFSRVADTETTPWTYFLLLHEWLLRTGSQSEWVTRMPSAVAGVALVGAVYWMAGAFVERRVAVWAAALCAISPLVQSYAQETRVYVFVMLALTVAVGATVRACHRGNGRVPLLTLGALSAFLAIWLHYSAVSVVLPLGVWVATRSELPWRERVGFVVACVVAQATVTPLLLEQYHRFPNGGVIAGAINWNNVVSVAGTPFGTRVGTPVNIRSIGGAAIVICSVLALVLSPRRKQVAERGLLVALGGVGVIGVFVLDLAGKDILITRYTAVSAPFLVTAIAAACASLPRFGVVVLAAGAVAVSAVGLIDNHSPSGFYAPARQVIDYIAPRERQGDFMLSPGFPLTDTPIFYYDTRRLRPKLRFIGIEDPGVRAVFRRQERIWIVDNPAQATPTAALSIVEPLLHEARYRAASVHVYTTSLTLAVLLVVPEAEAHHPTPRSKNAG
jgi:4-amino-4-deoxy-L-arabinose transferase-like glycosyltransferase